MPARILARTTPYRPPLRYNERICTRCGIKFTINTSRPHTKCRDCRHLPEE